MKKSQLKEIIRGIIHEELEAMNEKFTDYLPGKMNTASAEAERQGLKHAGFGRWKNQQGVIVARTVDGKLQAIAPNKQEPKKRNPATKPLDPNKDPHGPKDMKQKVTRAVKDKVRKTSGTMGNTGSRSPEVDKFMKSQEPFSEEQMTKMMGVSGKAFRAAKKVVWPSGEQVLGLDQNYSLGYDPKTNMYSFLDADNPLHAGI
jgi:hypothetical protein